MQLQGVAEEDEEEQGGEEGGEEEGKDGETATWGAGAVDKAIGGGDSGKAATAAAAAMDLDGSAPLEESAVQMTQQTQAEGGCDVGLGGSTLDVYLDLVRSAVPAKPDAVKSSGTRFHLSRKPPFGIGLSSKPGNGRY